jgi:hypothetical protein
VSVETLSSLSLSLFFYTGSSAARGRLERSFRTPRAAQLGLCNRPRTPNTSRMSRTTSAHTMPVALPKATWAGEWSRRTTRLGPTGSRIAIAASVCAPRECRRCSVIVCIAWSMPAASPEFRGAGALGTAPPETHRPVRPISHRKYVYATESPSRRFQNQKSTKEDQKKREREPPYQHRQGHGGVPARHPVRIYARAHGSRLLPHGLRELRDNGTERA